MWTASIRFNGVNALIGSKTSKYKIDVFSYPLSYFYEKNWIIVHIAGTMVGRSDKYKLLVEDLKKDPRVQNFELHEDFFIATIKEPRYTKCVYNKDIIHLRPTLTSSDGSELVTIGCFEKGPLTHIIKLLEDKYSGKLVFIQNKKVKSISIMKAHPDLTEKQKQAVVLAMKEGYYHSPRKIDIQKLAKISKLSYSTFQVHLRKAEEKLMPYFFE
jgi:predicted DNA binding protein